MTSVLSSDHYYQRFKQSIKAADTFRTYNYKLKEFMKFLKVNEMDYASLIEGKSDTQIESYLIDFIISLKQQNYSLNSQRIYLNALIHFYDINDVNVRRKKIARFMSNGDRMVSEQQQEGQGSGEKPYTREEISRLLEHANIRSRVMILLMCSTGMRIGALPFLKVGHLTLVPEHDLYQIHVDAYSKNDYFTFCTPECRKAIDSYLKFRRKCGENITGKSPLLRREFDKEDIFKVANNVRPLTVYAVRKTINELVYDSELRKPLISMGDIESKSKIKHNRRETALTHGFRKYFGTWCRHAGVSDSYVKWLSGRELEGSEDSYFLPQPDSGGIYRDMLEGHEHGRGPGYLDAIEFLTINEENKLKRKVEKLEEENDQIKELQRQIVEINQKIGKENPHDLSADIELYRKMNNDEAAIEEGRKGQLIIDEAKKDPELARLLGLTDGLFGLKNRKNV